MLRTASLISRSFLILVAFWISACVTSGGNPKTIDRVVSRASKQKVFLYPYESVWRAAQLSVKYPIAVNNMDSGQLETDWISAGDGFANPDQKTEPSAGVRYKLILSMAKGKTKNRDSVRVNLQKKLEKKRDFFSDSESMESDGLEEKVIFYRIERELVIEDAIKKAQAKGQL